MASLKKIGIGVFYLEISVPASSDAFVSMPDIKPEAKCAIEICYMADDNITVYGTISEKKDSETTFWQQINDGEKISAATSCLKLTNAAETEKSAIIKAIIS